MRPTRKSQPGFAGCPLGQPVFLAEGPARGILVVEGTRCGAQNSHLRVVPTARQFAAMVSSRAETFPPFMRPGVHAVHLAGGHLRRLTRIDVACPLGRDASEGAWRRCLPLRARALRGEARPDFGDAKRDGI